jgi:hypothetical protein
MLNLSYLGLVNNLFSNQPPEHRVRTDGWRRIFDTAKNWDHPLRCDHTAGSRTDYHDVLESLAILKSND